MERAVVIQKTVTHHSIRLHFELSNSGISITVCDQKKKRIIGG